MFFTIYIVIVSLAIVVGCVAAIIMSTSHGSAWLHALWDRRRGGKRPPDGA